MQREQAGLMVINYLTTSLRRQQLQWGSEYDSSLRARHQGQVGHKLAADVFNKFHSNQLLLVSSPAALFRSVNACVRAQVWLLARRACVRVCVTLCCSRHRSGLQLSIDQSGLRAEIKVFLSLDPPVAKWESRAETHIRDYLLIIFSTASSGLSLSCWAFFCFLLFKRNSSKTS